MNKYIEEVKKSEVQSSNVTGKEFVPTSDLSQEVPVIEATDITSIGDLYMQREKVPQLEDSPYEKTNRIIVRRFTLRK